MASEMAEEQIAEEVTPASTWEQEYRRGVGIGMLCIAVVTAFVCAARIMRRKRAIRREARQKKRMPLPDEARKRGRHEAP